MLQIRRFTAGLYLLPRSAKFFTYGLFALLCIVYNKGPKSKLSDLNRAFDVVKKKVGGQNLLAISGSTLLAIDSAITSGQKIIKFIIRVRLRGKERGNRK